MGTPLLIVSVLLLLGCASCAPPTASPDSPSGTPPSSSYVAPTTTRARSTEFGPHHFTVTGVRLPAGTWLTIGLHPTTEPIHVHTTSAVPLEVCPAGLDGEMVQNSSWPPSFRFPSCLATDGSGVATLPITDGSTHVAFAIRPVSTVGEIPMTVRVDYAAADSFVDIIPPVAGVPTDISITYTPRSRTTGTQDDLVGSVRCCLWLLGCRHARRPGRHQAVTV